MKAIPSLLRPAMLCILALLLAACTDEGEPSKSAILYDIVCLDSQDSAGSTFTLSDPQTRMPVTLLSRQLINTEIVPVGNRLLLAYIPASGRAYSSGSITIKSYGTIFNSKLIIPDDDSPSQPDSDDAWFTEPVYLLSAWISQCYLNLRLRLPYDNTPRRFRLILDPDSPDPEYPDLRLIHALKEPINTFDRAYYASFDISPLFHNPAVKGFTLHLDNSNLPLNSLKFNL